MTATITLEIVTEVGGDNKEQIDDKVSELMREIENLICGSVTVTNEEIYEAVDH